MTTTRTGIQDGSTHFLSDFDRFERMFASGSLNDPGPRIELLQGRIVEPDARLIRVMTPLFSDQVHLTLAELF